MSDVRRWVAVGIVAALVWAANPEIVRAETAERLATALEVVGFDLRGNHNPLSGGIDFRASREFDGVPFDFGAWSIALNGPLSIDVSTGGRLLSQFNVSFTTAPNGSLEASPLRYEFDLGFGPQATQVNGSVAMDVDFSMNRLGFYDLNMTYSGRQTRTTGGVQTGTDDFDVGPIKISGNLYADALALLTDPLFDSAGQPNFFVQLSGNDALEAMLSGSTKNSNELSSSTAKSIGEIAYRVIPPLGIGHAGERGTIPPGLSRLQQSGGAVPEPAVLVLMLLGIPAVLAHPRRKR